jgi:inner membrane protease subunit 1
MVPTIPAHFDGRPYVLFSCLHRRGRGVKVGDVIAYTHPIFPNEVGCKRIIGMPGDFVSVVTPGRRDEDVEAEDVDNKWASVKEQVIQVPEGHCWVAGDNLEWSRDSRLFGPLPLGLVKAKALAVAKPFKYGQWLGWFGGNWLDATWLGAKHDVKDAQEKEHEWTVPR